MSWEWDSSDKGFLNSSENKMELGGSSSSDASSMTEKISLEEKPNKDGESESKEDGLYWEDIREAMGEEEFWKELYIDSEFKPPSPDFYPLTVDEYNIYDAAVKASQGFDVPDHRDRGIPYLIHPISVRDEEAGRFKRLCDKAIAVFNREHQHEGHIYEYVKVLKINKQTDCSQGYIYYITFEAAAAATGIGTRTFQTKVMEAFWEEEEAVKVGEEEAVKEGEEEDLYGYPIVVNFCRLPPPTPTTTKGS